MSGPLLISTLLEALASALPIALAAMGGLLTEFAGSLSVALEGSMLGGAFAALVAFSAFASLPLAMLAAALVGASIGLLVGLVSTRLRADVFVAGLAANLLVPALVALASERGFSTKGVVVLEPAEASLAQGKGMEILVIFALLIFGLWLLVDRTVLGPRFRAAGEKDEAARAAGLDRDGLRVAAHAVAGAAAGLAGVSLSMAIGAFVPGMSAGRGWMALVAIYLGGKKPAGILVASLAFGLLLAFANLAQTSRWLPPELLPALPWLVTATVYIASRKTRRRA